MTFTEIKNQFAELGYEVEYKRGNMGRGYYVRQFGNSNYSFYEPSRALIEELLFSIEEENNRNNHFAYTEY